MNTLLTPALVIDRDAMERNMERMDAILSGTSMQLYPHYKSHKCPELARLQLARGAKGITCAKLGEALDLCAAGISNIVIANQVVQKEKLPVLAQLAHRCRLTVCVDNAQNVMDLQAAMADAGDGLLYVLVSTGWSILMTINHRIVAMAMESSFQPKSLKRTSLNFFMVCYSPLFQIFAKVFLLFSF